jgi:hypothetical protein
MKNAEARDKYVNMLLEDKLEIDSVLLQTLLQSYKATNETHKAIQVLLDRCYRSRLLCWYWTLI